MGTKTATSFRLSPLAMELVGMLKEKTGLSRTALVEMSLRRLAQREGISIREIQQRLKDEEKEAVV